MEIKASRGKTNPMARIFMRRWVRLSLVFSGTPSAVVSIVWFAGMSAISALPSLSVFLAF
jgi:hypothetical protein